MSQSNLSRLISPRSIAVVGHRGADFAIKGSLKLGYSGKIWAIHPSRETIEGLECYKSVRDLPEPPDATFIAVNAETAIEIVNTLIKKNFISTLQHAADMGIELHKAELALKYNFEYIQDKDLEIL